MSKKLWCVIAILLAMPQSLRADDPAAKWKLVWSDEFDYQGLPDAKKWDYEEGFIRNNEAQYYTRARLDNARVENGHLIIEGRKEKYANPRYNPNGGRRGASRQFAEYTSASLITHNKADWQYGRIEVRAKIPQGQGVWPAIWMLGADSRRVGWPAAGEIDIMEFVGHMPQFIHGTVHYQKDGKHASSGSKVVIDKPFDNFHVYAVEWSVRQMNFYVDKQKYFTFDLENAENKGQNPFHQKQYLLINLALGGSWGGKIDDAIFPCRYLVDYVRVYQDEAEK